MYISFKHLYWFHGHTCPMSTIGFRAGQLAKKLLKLKRKDYRVAVAKLYFKSCAIDGVQLSFPATYGNGNLIVFDEKDMRFEFERTDTKDRVTITFSEKLFEIMNHYLALRKRANDHQDKKVIRDMKKQYKFFLNFVQKAEEKDIFVKE